MTVLKHKGRHIRKIHRAIKRKLSRWRQPEMMVEKVCPVFVGKKSTLLKCLFTEARGAGISKRKSKKIISIAPVELLKSGAFFDKLSKIWRYEFGEPYEINGSLLWGATLWFPVSELVTALHCAYMRLSTDELKLYRIRLDNRQKHLDALSEMAPIQRVDLSIPARFEVSGAGKGNRTIDWLIGPTNRRTILIEVKRRIKDLIQHSDSWNTELASAPEHDPMLLFKDVEDKFVSSDPARQLQGCWIFTHLKQNESALISAFASLDHSKVHFAILGDWKSDCFMLVRNSADLSFLQEALGVTASDRFIF